MPKVGQVTRKHHVTDCQLFLSKKCMNSDLRSHLSFGLKAAAHRPRIDKMCNSVQQQTSFLNSAGGTPVIRIAHKICCL